MEPLSKSLQAAADLDTARCQGNWAVVPELAKRYKKYHPDESVIVATATYEAKFSLFVNHQRKEEVTSKGETTSTLEQRYRESSAWDIRRDSNALLTPIHSTHNNYNHHHRKEATTIPHQQQHRKSIWGGSNGTSNSSNINNSSSSYNKSTAQLIPAPQVPELLHDSDAVHCKDDPHHIALAPRLNAADTEKYLKALQELIKKHTKSDDLQTKDDRQAQLAKIVVARIYFETGRYDKALESLERLALRMEDVHSGYGMVLLVQARAIKAICYEMQGDIPTALETYGAAWNVFDQHPSEKGEMLSFWIEECLYRAILLHVRSESGARQVLPLMRGYMHLASSHWSAYWRMHKRWLIFQQYGRFLIKTCQDDTYYPMPITTQPGTKGSTNNNTASGKASAYEELLCLTALYRNLLSSITARSTTQERCRYVLELANFFVDTHNVIGWGEISNIRRVLQFLQKAKEHTFNSMCISRFIFFTFMRLGNYEEANYSLRSYMELMGLPDVDKTDENGIETTPYADLNVSARVERILSKLNALRRIEETATEHTKNENAVHENENEINVIEVLLAGIQLYGRELRNGKQAAFLGDLAVELASNMDPFVCDYTIEEWMPVMVACHRMRGTAYGLYAAQTHDPDNRAIYHNEALESLRKASEYDLTSWKVHYEIALQLAQMKDIGLAIASVGKSIQLKSDHIPSWHLLSLLNSCNQFRQIPQALQTIQAGLQECGSGIINVPTNITYGMPVLSWNVDEKHSRAYHDKCEAYLRLRITQLELLEALEGPDAALRGYGELFSMYTLLAQSLGMSEAQVAVQANESLRRIASINVKDSTQDSTAKRKSSVPTTPSDETSASPRSTRSSRAKSMEGLRRLSVSSTKQRVAATSDLPTDPVPPLPSADTSDELKARRKSTDTVRSTKDKSRKKSFVDIGSSNKRSGTPTVSHSSQTLTYGPRRESSQHSRLSIKRGSTAEELRRDSAPSEIIAPATLTPSFSLASMRSNSFGSSSISVATTATSATTFSSVPSSPSSNNASAFVQNQRERWHQLLVKLWLMSTNTFIKSGRFEEASKAIVEAEQLGLMDAGVWHQLGDLCMQTYKQEEPDNEELLEIALDAYKKALTLEPDHVRTHIDLAVAYIDMEEWELAEGLLERTTKGPGWDKPEAWYLLGTVYRQQEVFDQAKNCLLYAMELNEATPMGSFVDLPRFV